MKHCHVWAFGNASLGACTKAQALSAVQEDVLEPLLQELQSSAEARKQPRKKVRIPHSLPNHTLCHALHLTGQPVLLAQLQAEAACDLQPSAANEPPTPKRGGPSAPATPRCML